MCRARCHDCKAAISRNAENSERGLEADLRRRDKPAFRGSGCQSHPAHTCHSLAFCHAALRPVEPAIRCACKIRASSDDCNAD